ncbi:hypothetical protein PaeBR_18680 [Paenibacillus sp. BR2-3]|uniref:hypothetical protein n=1 Tax=Paenibacillus sp. BR2-3 TaxID=3048494 RepID=UPI0039775521
MPIPTFTGLPPDPTFAELVSKLNTVVKQMQNLLLNLDTLNIRSLNAEVIEAETITAGKLAANSVETENLVSGSVTAEKITVNELSAISADLGYITAGLIESIEIYGSYIATRNGVFPRAEMSNTEHLFAALTDANNHIKIRTDISGSPGVRFTSAGNVLGSLTTYLGYLEIWGPAILALTAPKVQFGSWYNLYNDDKGTTLGDELDNIWEAINNKADISHTHSVTLPNHNHGNPENVNSGGGTFTTS